MNNNLDNLFRDKHTKYSTYINNNKNNINTTLDNKHNEKILEFEIQNKLLNKKKKIYKNLLKDLNNNPNDESLKEKINIIETEINDIQINYNEIDYYDNTIDILLDYYNNENNNNNDNNIININDIFKKKK